VWVGATREFEFLLDLSVKNGMAPTSVEDIGKNTKNPEQDLGMLYSVLFFKKVQNIHIYIYLVCRP
jgi:hypothetical protein